MFLFQKGQAIGNCYTEVFPHRESAYAETCRSELLPQWLVLPIFGKSHCSRGYHRVFGKQNLDVLNYGLSLVINNKPSLLQSFNLLSEGKSLFGIFHSKKAKSRSVALPNRGRVPGSIGRKDMDLLRNLLIFYRKSA